MARKRNQRLRGIAIAVVAVCFFEGTAQGESKSDSLLREARASFDLRAKTSEARRSVKLFGEASAPVAVTLTSGRGHGRRSTTNISRCRNENEATACPSRTPRTLERVDEKRPGHELGLGVGERRYSGYFPYSVGLSEEVGLTSASASPYCFPQLHGILLEVHCRACLC